MSEVVCSTPGCTNVVPVLHDVPRGASVTALCADHALTVAWTDYPAPDIHVIKTPPPGEPLDEYIKRRVGEEITLQLAEELRFERWKAWNRGYAQRIDDEQHDIDYDDEQLQWLDEPVPVERPTEEDE